jgi:hypothetical protein
VIRNELCVGNYVYYRTRNPLRTRKVRNPPEVWIRTRIGPAIISRQLFARASRLAADGGRHRFTDDELLESLERLLARKGHLSPQLIDAADDLPTSGTFLSHFGTFEQAYARIGYKRPAQRWIDSQQGYWTEESILACVKRVFDEHGYVSATLLQNDPAAPSPNTISSRFGSLSRCYELAGCPHVRAGPSQTWQPAYPWVVKQKGYWTDEGVLQAVRRLFDQRGRVSAALIDADPEGPSAFTITKRFGSLNRCYELAGCPTTHRGRRAKSSRAGASPEPTV